MKNSFIVIGLLVVAIWVFYFSGSSMEKEQVKTLTQTVERQLDEVRKALDANTMRNDVILTTYAEQLKKTKPELAPLVTNLEKDATSENPAVKSLQERLDKVKSHPESVGSGKREDLVQELQLLKTATNPATFNDSLTDSINVLADLSAGSLGRINAPPVGKDGAVAQPGSQLVGNPNYGQWTQSNGMSVWEWYGAYAMFRDLFGGRNYNYNNWSQQRPWSYYNDYGRDTYGSRNERNAFESVDQRQRKTYGADSTRRTSSYSRKPNPAFSAPPVSSSRYESSSTPRRESKYTSSSRRSSSYSSGSSSRPRSYGGGRRR